MAHFKTKINPTMLMLLLLFPFSACHNFYKVIATKINTDTEKAAVANSLKMQNRYFVLRNGNQSYFMKDISLSADKKTLNCVLDNLSPEHQLHLVNGRRGKMQYIKNVPQDLGVLNEVHFFIDPDTGTTQGNYTLQLNKMQKIEIIERDIQRTANSYVIGAIGYTLGVVAFLTFIVSDALK